MARSRNLGYGEGSVYQEAGGRWRGELRVIGKRRRVSGWTRKEVVEKLDELRARANAGLPLGDDIRLGEWLNWFETMVVTAKDVNTRYSYTWAIKYLEPLRGKRLRDLEVDDVEILLSDLAVRTSTKKGGKGGQRKPLTKSSLNRIKMVLGSVLHEAERRSLVYRNVARLAHTPPNAQGPTPRRSLTVEEAQKLVGAVSGHEDEALVLVALTLGLRPGEVTGLPWAAVDLEASTLEVRQALKRLPDSSLVIAPPKVDSYRTIRLTEQLVNVLRHHQLQQKKRRLASIVWEHHGLVFPNALGRPMDSSNLRRMIKDHAETAGIGHLSPNKLRHSAASLLVATGIQLQDVSDMLGHRDIRMLAQTYRHKIRSVVDVTAGQERMLIG
jgi:integrase